MCPAQSALNRFINLFPNTQFSFDPFRFSHAAKAFESCDSKYRAVFAEPKTNSRSSNSATMERSSNVGGRFDDNTSPAFGANSLNHSISGSGASIGSLAPTNKRSMLNDYATFMSSAVNPANFNNSSSSSSTNNGVAASSNEFQLNIICSSSINQDQLWRLFDIVPGLEYCHITGDCGRNSNYATVAYCTFDAAQYAR